MKLWKRDENRVKSEIREMIEDLLKKKNIRQHLITSTNSYTKILNVFFACDQVSLGFTELCGNDKKENKKIKMKKNSRMICKQPCIQIKNEREGGKLKIGKDMNGNWILRQEENHLEEQEQKERPSQ